jgi:hypothetical protein
MPKPRLNPPEQTPEFILLSEAVILTGKNESTIRRFFKKPENKPNTQTKGGKVYVNKGMLLQQYPTPEQAPELPGKTPEQTPGAPEQAPETPRQPYEAELVALLKEQIAELKADKAMLKEQLEIKDRQLARADERTNYLLLQSNNHQPAQAQTEHATFEAPTPETPEPTPEEKPRGFWSRLFS